MAKEIVLKNEDVTLVSEEDYENLIGLRWSINPSGYATTGQRTNGHVLMHRMILDAPKGMQVDHINGDRLDNRRENLRLATHKENARNLRNTKTRKKYCTSQYKGVRIQPSGRWISVIMVDQQTINLGTYDLEEDAAIAYDRAAVKYFGEFAAPNFPLEKTKDRVLVPRKLNENRPILTGQRFGKWLVLREGEKGKDGKLFWECRCDCGKIALRKTHDLIHGKTSGCRTCQSGRKG